MEVDKEGIPKFEPACWEKWKRSVQIYILAKRIEDDSQKQAVILHKGGQELQDIFFALPGYGSVPTGKTIFQHTLDLLDAHFIPKINPLFERFTFRKLKQEENETIAQFVARLRTQAIKCNFANQDVEICDQIVGQCSSVDLRKKLLEKSTLNLSMVCEIAKTLEAITLQSEEFSKNAIEKGRFHENVNSLDSGKRNYKPKKHMGKKVEDQRNACYRCGARDHFKNNPNCPAKDKKCNRCKLIGHFRKLCKTKLTENTMKSKKNVCAIDNHDESDEYSFHVSKSTKKLDYIKCEVGGVSLNFLVDSGSSCNIITKEVWKKHRIKYIKKEKVVTQKLFGYASDNPLKVLGKFEAEIKVGKHKDIADFFVVDGTGPQLLGKVTSSGLGILRIGIDINKVDMKERPVFQGTGKLKNFQLDIPIDLESRPIAQKCRQIPIPLQKKVEEEIDKLLNEDIIEKVNGPTSWLSPIVPIMKANNTLRICVDMRQANAAVKRKTYPFPTMDDVRYKIRKSKFFTKLDVKQAFHQIELSQKSREITTFVTHTGIYRYKRLFFGLNCAPEAYQQILEQILQGLEGTINVFDDILIFAETLVELQSRTNKVLDILEEKGMTLNLNKCEFEKTEISFLGHVLNQQGMKAGEDKKEAIRLFRRPNNKEETASFLGLLTYVARFIPHLATEAEELRKLTRKHSKFIWGKEQELAFGKLKKSLISSPVLGYYDPNDETQVFCDASPIGLGAILVQLNSQGPRIIEYASRTLSDVERRYSQLEKEALALVWAVEKWNLYLLGKRFKLITDNKPVQLIFGPRSKPCLRIERWVLRLQTYDYEIIHRPGKSNIADPLSRLIKIPEKSHIKGSDEAYIHHIVTKLVPKSLNMNDINEQSRKDTEINIIKDCLHTGDFEEAPTCYKVIKSELCMYNNILLRGSRIVVPETLRKRVLHLAHEGHPGIVSMKHRLRSKVWWPGMDKQAEKYVRTCHGCQVVALPDYPQPMKRRRLPDGPWKELAIDLLGPLPSKHYLLVVVDYYSRFYEVDVLNNIEAKTIIKSLKKSFARFGNPISITSDNGRQFISSEYKEFCEENDIKIFNICPLWPQANGEVERQNRSILKRLKIAQASKGD